MGGTYIVGQPPKNVKQNLEEKKMLNYLLISPKELTEIEKIIFSCSGKPFCFFRRKDVLLINQELRKPQTLAKIAADLWKHDQLQDDQGASEIDSLCDQVLEIAGNEAAYQLLDAWRDALHEKLDAQNKAAAEWLQGRDILDELDSIGDSYRPGFIESLWSATRSTDAIFLYGYQAGMEAARKAALV